MKRWKIIYHENSNYKNSRMAPIISSKEMLLEEKQVNKRIKLYITYFKIAKMVNLKW